MYSHALCYFLDGSLISFIVTMCMITIITHGGSCVQHVNPYDDSIMELSN